MLSVIYGLAFMLMSMYWGTCTLGLVILSILSVILMSQSFSASFNMVWSLGPFSSLLILLSIMLCILSIISTPSVKSYSYMSVVCFLAVFLSLAFSASNLISFYVWFEASLIPTLLLIICWGYQPERLQAGTYMMVYTVGASLPLLAVIIWRCLEVSSGSFFMLSLGGLDTSSVVLLFIYGAFLVKLPMYGTHLWLPKAHVEAPLAGSMILAGILLKLGGFGLFQMNKCFCLCSNLFSSFLLISISIWGGLLAILVCLRQVDIKAYVAYSSVGHMGLVSSGIILDRTWGVSSSLVTMVAHGFASSALFCLAYYTYEKSHSRSMPYMGGMLKIYPILSFWWFIFCCINMAAPPTINLLGEMMIIPAAWFCFYPLAVVLSIMVFLSAAYNMYLYTSINHGDYSFYLSSGSCMSYSEGVSLLSHLVPLLIIFKSSVFLL